jgi:hypothetical protein
MAGPCVLLPVVFAIMASGIIHTMPMVWNREISVSRPLLAPNR